MDLRELMRWRGPIGIAVAVIFVVVWYTTAWRPRQDRGAELDQRIETLRRERDDLAQRIAAESAAIREERFVPSRVAPALTPGASPIERLNQFLRTITAPANDLELSYFAVTPMPPNRGPGYEEVPFSISLTGSFPSLADYLYQLEYAHDFVVRDLQLAPAEEGVRAEFQLAALVLDTPLSSPPATGEDPGRPSGLELARDPFTRPPAKLASGPDGRSYFLNVPPGLTLSGTMQTGGRMVAIINHEPYRVGMKIDNKTITRIDERGVELADESRSYFLEMEKPPASASTRPSAVMAIAAPPPPTEPASAPASTVPKEATGR